MGCDIHMYAEYAKAGDAEHWRDFGGHINPGRDYGLFAKLAGVRGEGAMFPVRGVPSGLSYEAQGDNAFFVTDSKGDRYVSRDTAQGWVDRGISQWTDDRECFVTDPDNHTHSWVTPAELRQALEAPGPWPHGDEYWALLAALEELERRGNTARVVFWFDN